MSEPRVAKGGLSPAAQNEIVRTIRQKNNLDNLLNREKEVTFHDGAPWMAPVYDMAPPRRKDGRLRTRNGQPLPSEYDRRRQIIERAYNNRIARIRQKYNL